MTLGEFADLADIIGALGVIAGLIFVGVQLRQNTNQMVRGEANSAMSQASALRHLMLSDRQAAELIFSGIAGAPLDPIDEIRMNALFSEIAYMSMSIWDRVRKGLAPIDELTRIAPTMATAMASARGRAWWARSRGTLIPEFVTEFERLLPALALGAPSATAPQGAESAVAPSADAG